MLVDDGEGLDGLQLSNSVLPRLHRRLGVVALAAVDRDPIARFGTLAISDRQIQSSDDAPLAREQVDGIGVVALTSRSIAGGTVELRVMRTGGTRAYCAIELEELPNVGGLIEVAAALGYPVRGRDLLATLGIDEIPRKPPVHHVP